MADDLPEDRITVIAAEALSYEAFCASILTNRPLMVSGVRNDWRACREWTTTDGKPNLTFLKENFGASNVQVADCGQQRFSDQERLSMTLTEFVDYWEQHMAGPEALASAPAREELHSADMDRATQPLKESSSTQSSFLDTRPLPLNNIAASAETLRDEARDRRGSERAGSGGFTNGGHFLGPNAGGEPERRLLYLKDWHFVAEYPEYGAYETPVFFQDDWLNEYLDHYPMQYKAPEMGSKGEALDNPGLERHHSTASPAYISPSVALPADESLCTEAQTDSQGLSDQPQSPPESAETCAQPVQGSSRNATPGKSYPEQTKRNTPTLSNPTSSSKSTAERDSQEQTSLDREPELVHTGSSSPRREVECADYRFVYMGPAGSWTPCHSDVLRSYSWSVNVCGRKRWRMLPPEQAWMLYDRHGRSTVYDIEAPVDRAQFPHFHQTRWLECIQEPGDAIFVPSGWFHQVTNLEDTISINHNWLNGYNIHWAWKLLREDYRDTVASIEDCRELSTPEEFEGLCQRNLQLNSGTNFSDFFAFVGTMALDKARKLRALADSSRPGSAREDPLAPHETVSELSLGLNGACRVLKGLGIHLPQNCLHKATEMASISEASSVNDSTFEHVLRLPRDAALACGPLIIVQAVESLVKKEQERRGVVPASVVLPKEVIPWRR